MAVEYRTLARFPGYRFGSDGSIWSCWLRGNQHRMTDMWRPMKCHVKGNGYLVVWLKYADRTKVEQLVHRLIIEAFKGPCPDGLQARNFPDRNQINNSIDNLSWGTVAENAQDRVKHGTQPRGTRFRSAKLNEAVIPEIRRRFAAGESMRSIGRAFGVHGKTISDVVNGTGWQHVA